jgi:aerobic carbon-monoxide dehydrogenase large subunit
MSAQTPSGTPYIGQRVRRLEDAKLLVGKGRYTDDIKLPGTLSAAFVRSGMPHAVIESIDVSAARDLPGVVAVFTQDDLAAVLTQTRMPLGFNVPGLPDKITPFVLARDEVAFVGEAVAVVVAETRYIAEDAATLVQVDYTPLPPVSDPRAGLVSGSPTVRRETDTNVLKTFSFEFGAIDAAFASASHVFTEEILQHRGGAHPMEGRAVLAHWDPVLETLTAWSSTQMPHELYFMIAMMLGLDENQVHVMVPDVGGGFGCKFLIYPEEIAIAAASRLLGRPVKWIEDRGEHFVASIQERDQFWTVEIAVDGAAKILGVRGKLVHDQGAYTPQGVNLPYNAASGVTGPYMVGAYRMDVTVVHTNKVPTIPIRGAGYPEAAFIIERLIDRVARELDLDRAEVRRRNLIPAEKMPYIKPLKVRSGAPMMYDSGDYPACMAEVLATIDWTGFPARQQAARQKGRFIGIGLSNAVKGTGRGPFETGLVRVSPTGRITVHTGAAAMGQGMHTALAQICSDALGVTPEEVHVISGDTKTIPMGLGGFGSRQLVTAGSSVLLASREVAEKARKYAAHVLEAAEADLVLDGGRIHVNGLPEMGLALSQVAAGMRGVPGYSIPAGVEPGLEATSNFRTDSLAYANACHAVEVEVDPDSGIVKILRYVAMQDVGRRINPLIVEGQVVGGIVHGIGNALFEWMGYDEGAQPITTTFADYLLPTAPEIPRFELLYRESASPLNPLGAKGVGEVGTIAVAPAIASAVEDALRPFGVHIDTLPILPGRLFELIHRGKPPGF